MNREQIEEKIDPKVRYGNQAALNSLASLSSPKTTALSPGRGQPPRTLEEDREVANANDVGNNDVINCFGNTTPLHNSPRDA